MHTNDTHTHTHTKIIMFIHVYVCEEHLLSLAACLKFDRVTYTVSESNRRLPVTLRLDIPASYDIPVEVEPAAMEAHSKMCNVLLLCYRC